MSSLRSVQKAAAARGGIRSSSSRALLFAIVLTIGFALLSSHAAGPSDAGGASREKEKAAIRSAYSLVAVDGVSGDATTPEWRARNQAHGLLLDFQGSGVRVQPDAQGSVPAWLWSMTLDRRAASSLGDASTQPIPTVVGNRIAFTDGDLTQWFLNDARGVQHGMRLAALPGSGSGGSSGTVVIDLMLDGNLTRKPSREGRAVSFLLGGEQVLSYHELRAADALGRAVPVWMDLTPNAVGAPALMRILVETAKAAYPVTVTATLDSSKGSVAGPNDFETYAPLAAPSNDECSGALVIPASGPFPYATPVTADITDATMVGDPSLPSCQTDVSRSIWYRFTPSTTADYTISSCANATGTTVDDTVIAVYTSSTSECGGLYSEEPGACDDDSCTSGDLQSVVTKQLEAGTTYFILVWQFGSAPPPAGATSVQLRVEQANPVPPPPSNDQCPGAELIPGGGPFPHVTATIADISGAKTTGDPPPPSCALLVSRSVWYAFSPTTSANYTFSSCADAPTNTTVDDTVIAIYTSSTSSCGGTLTEVTEACDDDSCSNEAAQATVTASLSSGTTYYVVVWQRGTAPPTKNNTAVQLRVSQSFPPPPPPNDQCSAAEAIPGSGPFPYGSATVADITGATIIGDPPAPTCGGASRSRSLWYAFTPAASASYTLSVCAGDGAATTVDDTVLAVYASSSSDCGGTLTQVTGGCDDDGCAAEEAQSTVTTTLAAGTKYFVVVWKKGVGVPATGHTAVQLLVTRGANAPPNDNCSGAETIPDGPYPVSSAITADISGASASGDPAGPSCQTNRSRGVWYRFAPSQSGYYTISTCADAPTGTTVDDTVLGVYTSSAACAGPFAELPGANCADGCDDDSCVSEPAQSTVTTYLAGGTTYYVLAWIYGTSAPVAGNTAVQVRIDRLAPVTAPPNDGCAAAEEIPAAGPFPLLTALIPDVTGATCVGDPPAPTCEPYASRSVWYRFTPASSGTYEFSACADAPTGTTLDDTVLGIYASDGGCDGPFTQLGCDDDACATEVLQSVVTSVLTAGRTYWIVAWQFGTLPPAAGNSAIQLRVAADLTPPNDRCASAPVLALDAPLEGTTVAANDDYRITGPACFTGIGQTATEAPGRDVTYAFTAPAAGDYSFKVYRYAVAAPHDAALYVASQCEFGTPPVVVTSCLAASNRNVGGSSEEAACVPLGNGQTVWVYVDDATAGNPGSSFTIEVNRCQPEAEPNGTTAEAGLLACPVEGSIGVSGDVDFYALGIPSTEARVFAIVDGVAGNSNDFDLRVTTATQTLEYDDANNDGAFGNASPNAAGTKATGEATFVRVNHKSPTVAAEPYRLYAVVQPPAAAAVAESEPNDTIATANVGDLLYGSLPAPGPSSDIDVFRFEALAGDVLVVGLDGDPGYDNTNLNAKLEVLDAAGTVLLTANDNGSTGSVRAPASLLTATTPVAPGEALTFRVPGSGTYYVRVSVGTTGSSGAYGDYLLSLSPNCLRADADGDGVPNATDCAREDPTVRVPNKVAGLAVIRTSPSPGDVTVAWTSQDGTAGTETSYDVARGLLSALRAGGFSGSSTCAANDLPDTPYTEPGTSCGASGADGCWYLVRAQNTCGTASWADASQSSRPLDGGASPCP